MNLLAAAGYLIGLVIIGFFVIFGIPALLWIVAVSL